MIVKIIDVERSFDSVRLRASYQVDESSEPVVKEYEISDPAQATPERVTAMVMSEAERILALEAAVVALKEKVDTPIDRWTTRAISAE